MPHSAKMPKPKYTHRIHPQSICRHTNYIHARAYTYKEHMQSANIHIYKAHIHKVHIYEVYTYTCTQIAHMHTNMHTKYTHTHKAHTVNTHTDYEKRSD